ncbi:hypothetical protein DSM2777_00520 [Obesumbacterium proteus]|nr:hypothetical protein DSM2777_00520 [Obesumbacterium proteus]
MLLRLPISQRIAIAQNKIATKMPKEGRFHLVKVVVATLHICQGVFFLANKDKAVFFLNVAVLRMYEGSLFLGKAP